MYSTCLFCQARLGANREIEFFPVGTRLAFDSARGRLWVVCARCGRWNLSPLEERWEAVEECERLFAATPLRGATGEVALARTRGGLDLVRIGRPERAELATWRWGPRSLARRRLFLFGEHAVGANHVLLLGLSGLSLGTLGVVIGGFSTLLTTTVAAGCWYHDQHQVVARIDGADGERPRIVRARHLEDARLLPADDGAGWKLQVPHTRGMVEVWGRTAEQAAARILAHHNWYLDDDRVVRDAVRELERHPAPMDCFAAATRVLQDRPMPPTLGAARFRIGNLPFELTLALEMAVSEATERDALEGELAALEAAWRGAEEIAAIADRLAIPDRIEQVLRHARPAADG